MNSDRQPVPRAGSSRPKDLTYKQALTACRDAGYVLSEHPRLTSTLVKESIARLRQAAKSLAVEETKHPELFR